MKKYIQTEFIKISRFSAPEWQHPVHNHNHFEIIYIHKGKGNHCISARKHRYQAGSIFLLAPCDFHEFEIEEKTEFTFIKFTNVYFTDAGSKVMKELYRDIETLFVLAGTQTSPLLKNSKDKKKIDGLVNLITDEWKESKTGNDTIFYLVQTLISIVKRNVQDYAIAPGKSNDKATSILNYIHLHIFSNENLKLEKLASIFGFSRHYLGIFFKAEVGLSLREYISQYKLQLIKTRLRSSSLSIKEISYEMGFTDLSHFNKFFKTHTSISPSEFRNDRPWGN